MEPLAKILGSQARLKTLRLFSFNQETEFTISDVTKRTKLSTGAAHREVAELCASGFLRKKTLPARKRVGRAGTAYQVNPRFEYLMPLEVFIRDTTTVRPRSIVNELRHAGTIQLVALSGFFCGVIESQLDLLVVGDKLNDRALAKAVHSLEAELGREIRYASFATADFRYRLGVYDRLLRDIFDYPHRLLVDRIGM